MNSLQPIDSSDPRITAYVLGELPTAEALAVEAWLAKNPDARSEVDGIREMTALLQGGFAAELDAAFSTPVRDLPPLTVVPTAPVAERPKVVKFHPLSSHRLLTARTAVAAAAAVLVATAFIAGKLLQGSGESPNLAIVESAKVQAGEAQIPGEPIAVPYTGVVPGFTASGTSSGIHLASAGFLAGEEAEEFQSRSLGTDPTITEVRFLSDDPLELQNVPLPAELLTYLPGPRGGGAVFSPRSTYLDSERYPNPEIVQGRLESAGEIDGRRAHSLFIAETQPGPNGSASIKVTGAVRVDDAAEAVKAARLKEAGRELISSGDYESATVVLEKAREALPDGGSTVQLRKQIETLLEAANQLSGSTR